MGKVGRFPKSWAICSSSATGKQLSQGLSPYSTYSGLKFAASLVFVSELQIGWLVGVQPAIFLGDHPIGHRLRVGPRVNGRGSFAPTF